MLTIFYGRESLNKEKFIFDRMKETRGKAILLVPDQFTLQAEKEAFHYLNTKILMDVEILSFSRLGARILAETGGSQKTPIDERGRFMLLAKIIAEQESKLQLYKSVARQPSFVQMAGELIGEMRQYDTTAADLSRLIDALGEDSILRKKLADMQVIYRQYEQVAAEKYLDGEDYIELFISQMSASPLVRDAHCWVYGFDYFTPKHRRILAALTRCARALAVVLTYDGGAGADSDLFALTGEVAAALRQDARENGAAADFFPIPPEYARRGQAVDAPPPQGQATPGGQVAASTAPQGQEMPCGQEAASTAPQGQGPHSGQTGNPTLAQEQEALRAVEQGLFSVPAKTCANSGGITLVKAANITHEIESAAACALTLIRDQGLRHRDIAIVCNDMEVRGKIAKRIFASYGIPLFLDKKRTFAHSPAVRFIVSLLHLAAYGIRDADFFCLLKTGLVDITEEQAEALELYARKYKIKGNQWKRPFLKGAREYGASLSEMEETRKTVIGFLAAFEKPYKKAKTAGQKTEVLCRFLIETAAMPEKLEQLARRQSEDGFYELADETAQTWAFLINLFDQLVSLIGDAAVLADRFADILRTGLDAIEIGLLPPAADGLIAGTMQRIRIGRVKALLVVGANDGLLPADAAREGLISDDETARLFGKGVEICRREELRIQEGHLAIYRNLSKPERFLWMSCSLSDSDGNKLNPSRIFEKIQEIFPALVVQKDIVSAQDPEQLLQAKDSSLFHLTSALRDALACDRLPAAPWNTAMAWHKEHNAARFSLLTRGLLYQNREEDVRRELIGALYQREAPGAPPADSSVSSAPGALPAESSAPLADSSAAHASGGLLAESSALLAELDAPPTESNTPLVVSPSRLEKFGRCPFAHFVAYGARPEELRLYEVAGREIGEIYHSCLMRFSMELSEPGRDVSDPASRWMTLTREVCDDMVDRIVDAETSGYREGVFSRSNEEVYRAGRIKEVCAETAWRLTEHVRQGKIKSIRLEQRFGDSARRFDNLANPLASAQQETALPPIEVGLSDGRRVLIEGQIDRVDALADGRLKIIDYKSGKEKFSVAEALAGWRLQLMLYLKAARQERLEPAGVFYFLIDEQPGSGRMDGVAVDQASVVENIAGTFQGYSDIIPLQRLSDGRLKGNTAHNLMSAEDFEAFQRAVDEKVRALCSALLDGRVAARPKRSGEATACTYCGYRSICRFDLAFDGCAYEDI